MRVEHNLLRLKGSARLKCLCFKLLEIRWSSARATSLSRTRAVRAKEVLKEGMLETKVQDLVANGCTKLGERVEGNAASVQHSAFLVRRYKGLSAGAER